MIYGSVCSGVEAATVAWHHLGWQPAWFCEFDKFPSAVLNHHYPEVPNLGDMTKIEERPEYARTINLLVGGTPCQSFSVAGLRKGLADDRGNLALKFCEILRDKQPRWFVWENVPGVLSSNGGRDFAAILSGFRECGYGFAYRVLDAQYFGVAQRRRRVFVVGCLGDWRPAAAVLFERESVRGYPAPRREAGEKIAPCVTQGPPFSRTGNQRVEAEALVIQSPETYRWQNDKDGLVRDPVAGNIRASGGTTDERSVGAYVVSPSHDPAMTLTARESKGPLPEADLSTVISYSEKVATTLKAEGFDSSEDGTGRQNLVVHGTQDPCVQEDKAFALGRNSGGENVICAIQERAICENPSAGPDGVGIRSDGLAYTLEARQVPQAVAYGFKAGQGAAAGGIGYAEEQSPTLTSAPSGLNTAPTILRKSMVRRLTPRECERLQGFPDDYTLIPMGKKMAADGPRYKAMGNSMAVPVMRWIGERINEMEKILNETA